MYSIDIMDFRKLQAFSKVYEHRSFSKAGKELFLSQPTISAHVQGLEDELGVLLFDRIGRSVMPTGAADILYEASLHVFRRLDAAKSEIDLMQDRIAGAISIGASTIPAHWVLPDLLAGFKKQYPEVSFSMHVQGTASIGERVISGELDIGIVGAPVKRHGVASIPVFDDEVVAVAAPSLVTASNLSKKPLNEWPWILRERSSGTRKVFEGALETAGKRIAQSVTSTRLESTQGVLAFARSGLGVGVLSKLAAEPDIEAGNLQVLDLGIPPITRHLYIVHLEGKTMPPAVTAFMNYLQQSQQSGQ